MGRQLGGWSDTVRHEVGQGLGLQSISNREPLQLLEDGRDKRRPRCRTGTPEGESRVAESGRDKGQESGRGHGAARAGNATAGRETGARRCSKAAASGYACWAWGGQKDGGLRMAWV